MGIKTESEIDQPVEDILDTIGDEYARKVLTAICESPRSAKELANELDHSIQTIYRRVDILKANQLIRTQTAIADDGNHYQVYESNFDSVLISMEGDEYEVRIYRREDLPDRFTDLWDELSR